MKDIKTIEKQSIPVRENISKKKHKKHKSAFIKNFITKILTYGVFFIIAISTLLGAKGTYNYYRNKITIINKDIDSLQSKLTKKKQSIKNIQDLSEKTQSIPVKYKIISNFKIEYLNEALMPITKEFKFKDLKNELKDGSKIINLSSSGEVKLMSYVLIFGMQAYKEEEIYRLIDYLQKVLPGYSVITSLNVGKMKTDKKNNTMVRANFELLWFHLEKK